MDPSASIPNAAYPDSSYQPSDLVRNSHGSSPTGLGITSPAGSQLQQPLHASSAVTSPPNTDSALFDSSPWGPQPVDAFTGDTSQSPPPPYAPSQPPPSSSASASAPEPYSPLSPSQPSDAAIPLQPLRSPTLSSPGSGSPQYSRNQQHFAFPVSRPTDALLYQEPRSQQQQQQQSTSPPTGLSFYSNSDGQGHQQQQQQQQYGYLSTSSHASSQQLPSQYSTSPYAGHSVRSSIATGQPYEPHKLGPVAMGRQRKRRNMWILALIICITALAVGIAIGVYQFHSAKGGTGANDND